MNPPDSQTLQLEANNNLGLRDLIKGSLVNESMGMVGNFGGVTDSSLAKTKEMKKSFQMAVLKRDRGCIASGHKDGLMAKSILPLHLLNSLESFYSPRNGIVLHCSFAEAYEKCIWIFDHEGTVTCLFPSWIRLFSITSVRISQNPETGPSKEFITKHNEIARMKARHHCPHCWKCVGATNIEIHTKSHCRATNGSESSLDSQ